MAFPPASLVRASLSRYTRIGPHLQVFASSSPSLLATSIHKTQVSSPSPTPPIFRSCARAFSHTSNMATDLRFKHPAIFVCDLQEKFQGVIYEFDSIVTTTQKLLNFAQALSIPIHATTQTSAKLGPTIPALASLLPSTPHDKTKFSMFIAPIASALPPASRVALVGIESHICITQTALDLRDAGHVPYIIADAVSSCNRGEVVIALDRLRSEPGVIVTTSESWMYECLGDSSHPAFKGLMGVVKGSLENTRKVLNVLPPPPSSKM